MPAKRKSTTLTHRAELVRYWSKWFYEHTDSFRGALGEQLAYLWPAIISDNRVVLSPRSALVRILKKDGVPLNSEIWDFINTET